MAEHMQALGKDVRQESYKQVKGRTDDLSTGLKFSSPFTSRNEKMGDIFNDRLAFPVARPLADLFDQEYRSPLFTPRKNVNLQYS